VVIEVSDTGTGMDEKELQRLFEPFFTTKSCGTGLGLASVYRIVEAHAGRISVRSMKGQGTVFTLVFPGGGSAG
jgi:two-component system sensor histidine kinase PilS (NtrC family)